MVFHPKENSKKRTLSRHNVTQQTPQRCLNVAFWLLRRRGVGQRVKSTLKQHCVFQRWNLQRRINVEST